MVKKIIDHSINLWNGIANLNIKLPSLAKPGDLLHFQSEVNDISRVEPFIEEFFVQVEDKIDKKPGKPGKRKPPSSDKKGKDAINKSYLDLPNVIEVYEDDWDQHSFNKESALKVIDSGEDGYDFFINMDNIHLLTEKKANTKVDTKLLSARYKYGMVLIGIALLKDDKDSSKKENNENREDEEASVYEKISYLTKAISPMLLPMISGLGELEEEKSEIVYE